MLVDVPDVETGRIGIHVVGWFGTTTGAGRKPPSVPIWIQPGPTG